MFLLIFLFSKLSFYLANLGYFYLVNKMHLLILLFLFGKIFNSVETICFISSLFTFFQMAINIYFVVLSISIHNKVAN